MKSEKNNLMTTIIIVVLAAGVAFYSGMQMGKKQCSTINTANGQPMQQNGPNAGDQKTDATGTNQAAGKTGGMKGGGMQPVSGQITSKDSTSITVKMTDGSSKIVILSTQTKVMKTTDSSVSALTTGEQVLVSGSTNSDGSVTAQNISIGGSMPGQPGAAK